MSTPTTIIITTHTTHNIEYLEWYTISKLKYTIHLEQIKIQIQKTQNKIQQKYGAICFFLHNTIL
jgi:hypothetical protein